MLRVAAQCQVVTVWWRGAKARVTLRRMQEAERAGAAAGGQMLTRVEAAGAG